MKYKNKTDKFQSFSSPVANGGVRFYSAAPNEVIEVPDLEGWRAEKFGFEKVLITAPKIVIPIKKKK